jgi:hypothetical protein
MSIGKFYRVCIVWLLCTVLLCPALVSARSSSSGSAQSRDHLTSEEVELVRGAQVLDARTAVFIKAIERRLMVLTNPDAASSRQVEKDMKKWGQLPKGTRGELLMDIAKILGEATTNIDDVYARDPKNPLLPKALLMLADASRRFLSQLKPMRAQFQGGAEREALEQSIENAQQILEAADKLPAEEGKGKKTKD